MFNDPVAHRFFQGFQARYKFETIIETGTNMGKGALHCALYRDRVCTIEVDPEHRDEALLSCAQNRYQVVDARPEFGELCLLRDEWGRVSRIHSFVGSSPEVLDHILVSSRFPGPFLFYLDAHGNDYWPLLDELRTIAKHGLSQSCIIIHDVQVPGKPWGYDTWKGQPLNLDYVRDDLMKINPTYLCFYNSEACEGRAARGILYVVPE